MFWCLDAEPQRRRVISFPKNSLRLGASASNQEKSNIEIPHVERVVFDELSARLDLVAHQRGEHLIGFGVIFRTHLQQRAPVRIHRRRPQLLRVHLTEALIAVDGHALFAGVDEVLEQRLE